MARKQAIIVSCDGCGKENVPTTAWRLSRGRGRIRHADLCAECEALLVKIYENAGAASGRPQVQLRGLPVATMEEIEAMKAASASSS